LLRLDWKTQRNHDQGDEETVQTHWPAVYRKPAWCVNRLGSNG